MSSTYQPVVELDGLDTQLPELLFSEPGDYGNDLSLQSLDYADPTLLSFNPFEFHVPAASESLGLTEGNQIQSLPQDLTTDISALDQLNELNLLYLQLQERVNELDANCVKLHNAYVSKVHTRKCLN